LIFENILHANSSSGYTPPILYIRILPHRPGLCGTSENVG
jgi:hypothetical protein